MIIKHYFFVLVLMIVSSCDKKGGTVNYQGKNLSYDGIWAESEEENALFKIKGDTVINVEHGDKMPFKAVNDTLIIDYDGVLGKYLILRHTADSLILENEDKSITRLYNRRKNDDSY